MARPLESLSTNGSSGNDTVKDTSANEPPSRLILPKVPAEKLRLREKIMEYLAGRLVPEEYESYLRVGVYSLMLVVIVLDGP